MTMYPTISPAITLDFKKSKQLDPRISFSRSSTATYVEGGVIKTADEHQARFEKEGLLIEESRTNLCEYSIPSTANGWAETNANLTTNAVTAPDGTTTAATLIEDSNTGIHRVVLDPFAGQNGTTYTTSVYVKAFGRTTINLQSGNSGQNIGVQNVDLTAGTITPQTGTDEVGFIEPVGNGWYRVGFTYTMVTFNGSVGMQVYLTETLGGSTSYAGDGSSGIYIWGGQHEQGNFGTSYIPTAGSTVIRAADIFNITGNNFSSWYNPIESTMVVNMSCKNSTGYGLMWGFYGGKRIEGYPGLGTPFSGLCFFLGDDNTQKYIGLGPTWNQEHEIEKCAYSWNFSSGEGTACLSGNFAPNPPPATGVPITTITGGFRLMGGQNASNVTNTGIVSSVAYYPRRLTDLVLQTITL